MYNQYYPNYYSNNNRFGGALAPFILGGIAGSLWNNNRPIYFFPAPFYPIPPYRPRPWQYR